MKKTIRTLLGAALALTAVVASAQSGLLKETATTKTYFWPGTAACYDTQTKARISSTAFETTQEANDFIVKYLDDKRKVNPNTEFLEAFCQPTTMFTNALKPKPVPPPVVVVPPVVVAPPVIPIVNPPVTSMSPGIGKIPANGARVNAGTDKELIGTTSEVAQHAGDDTGDFRTRIETSHFAFDDPLVYPGQPGRSHLHVFFGNTATNASTTIDSLRTNCRTTARGGTANCSAYWVAAMIDTSTGFAVIPDPSDFYYKSGYRGVDRTKIVAMPEGLRMIAGDPKNAVDLGLWGASPYVWKCHNNGAVQSTSIITTCPVGDQLELSLGFPQCWDGKNLDSPDHKSHMAYANGGCPPSHPVAIPEVSFHILWPIRTAGEARNWRLSSDIAGNPAGYTAHGDWMNGWKPDVSAAWSKFCVAAGNDCHSHLYGDGRYQY